MNGHGASAVPLNLIEMVHKGTGHLFDGAARILPRRYP